MLEIVTGTIAVALPFVFIIILILADSEFKWKQVFIYFAVMGLPALGLIFYNPISNLKNWQIGVLGILFSFALVGLHHLIERNKDNRIH